MKFWYLQVAVWEEFMFVNLFCCGVMIKMYNSGIDTEEVDDNAWIESLIAK